VYRIAISITAGVLITGALCIVLLPIPQDDPLNIITKILLWPITALMHMAGPGPGIGPPEKHLHEGTPVHVLAFLLGTGFSCIFYSALTFLFLRVRAKSNSGDTGVDA
jgi:hypothetical protein